MTHPLQPIDYEEALAPIFRELGKALYIAQQFETCLLYLLALLNHREGKIDQHTFAEGFCEHEKKTLGQIAKAFREKLSLYPTHFSNS